MRQRDLLGASAVCLVLFALADLATQATAQPLPPRSEGFRPVEPLTEDVEAQIIERTNAFRAEHGRGTLAQNATLTGEARDFAAYLARTGELSHSADGRTPADRALAAGYDYCDVAENLAFEQDVHDFRNANPAKGLVEGWENSPSHRRNMLDPDVVDIGVGVVRAPNGIPKYVAVQVFGRPASTRVSFRVTNRTQFPVSYAYAGVSRRIGPGSTISYDTCTTGALVFNTRGSAGKSPYPAEPGGLYILKPDAAGGVRVEISRSGA
jgi:uncharacterized protein YkwD